MTRQEYLNSPIPRDAAHRTYYAQFVNQKIKDTVSRLIGIDFIRASKESSFNDIPLYRWDFVAPAISTHELCQKLKEVGDYATLAGLVCIAKEAARQIKESKQI